MNTDDVTTAVTAWATRALHELTIAAFAQIDLDELLDDPPQLAGRAGLTCLQLAMATARRSEPAVDGILTIPLASSDSLTLYSASLEGVLADRWEYGSGLELPGLYLVTPSFWRAHEDIEEYRRDLPAGDELPSGYAAYYRTWRSQADATHGWEYTRAIYVRTVDRP